MRVSHTLGRGRLLAAIACVLLFPVALVVSALVALTLVHRRLGRTPRLRAHLVARGTRTDSCTTTAGLSPLTLPRAGGDGRRVGRGAAQPADHRALGLAERVRRKSGDESPQRRLVVANPRLSVIVKRSLDEWRGEPRRVRKLGRGSSGSLGSSALGRGRGRAACSGRLRIWSRGTCRVGVLNRVSAALES